MRRSDREITDRQEIADVMKRCDVCRLALNNGDYPYILPLNFGMEAGKDGFTLYFHSALEGYKLELIGKDNRASFEMDCRHQLQYFEEKGYCTYAYESVIGKGHITIVNEEEKAAALAVIMEHYHPGENAYFNPAAISRTIVYKLAVEEITAKRKKPKNEA